MSGIGNAVDALVDGVVAVLVVLGTVIMLISSLGVLRLPDVYTRAHATTKSATLGVLCILGGTFIHFLYHHHLVSIRLILVIFFVFMTAPVAGHMIIRAAHRAAFPLADISVRDAIRDDFGHPGDADKAADAGADEAGADGGGTAEDDGAMAEDDAAEADDEATAEDDAMADGNRQEGGTDHERA